VLKIWKRVRFTISYQLKYLPQFGHWEAFRATGFPQLGHGACVSTEMTVAAMAPPKISATIAAIVSAISFFAIANGHRN
jgi:hypothetical protein